MPPTVTISNTLQPRLETLNGLRTPSLLVLNNTIGLNKKINKPEVADLPLMPEILCITSYPPRECGIATYSHDLVAAITKSFSGAMTMKVCAIQLSDDDYAYEDKPAYILNANQDSSYLSLVFKINKNPLIKIVFVQHEFGLFSTQSESFLRMLANIEKPIVLTFHTILPHPNEALKASVQAIAAMVDTIIVMTHTSAEILTVDYLIPAEKIEIIAHGTHLVTHENKEALKKRYRLEGRQILSTFGLLGSGKSIETTLDALPAIVEKNPDVLFLIIGKTHPNIVKTQGEAYRDLLKAKIDTLQLGNNIRFIQAYLPLKELLAYLQLTDIYLFTSKDRNQAVSGTFSYAISCGCAIVSTPIPHAKEVLKDGAGVIFNFENSQELSVAVNRLLADEQRRLQLAANGLHRIAPTAWENTALAHVNLFHHLEDRVIRLKYNLPDLNLNHVENMTKEWGILQFSKLNQPDLASGYTLDDNARALIAYCKHFQLTGSTVDLACIERYFQFIKFCFQPSGSFLNYVNEAKTFTAQNYAENLEDSNGRAMWALGYLVSHASILPTALIEEAKKLFQEALGNALKIHSTRAMAFIIKGIFYANNPENDSLLITLANRLLQMYRHEKTNDWHWFEDYLTYGNAILPDAMLCAYVATNNPAYKLVAKESFDFLLSKTFEPDQITVISNKGWWFKGKQPTRHEGGEQPIDVAYSILALKRFYQVFHQPDYQEKMIIAFSWFLGNNRLRQIIYNPCTGGCYDGLEDKYVNLNQGAESSISYLMARLEMNG